MFAYLRNSSPDHGFRPGDEFPVPDYLKEILDSVWKALELEARHLSGMKVDPSIYEDRLASLSSAVFDVFAEESIAKELADGSLTGERLHSLHSLLGFEGDERLECYDQGEYVGDVDEKSHFAEIEEYRVIERLGDLFRRDSPLEKLGSWPQIMLRMSHHMERFRDKLLENGMTPKIFCRSHFLDRCFGLLYPEMMFRVSVLSQGGPSDDSHPEIRTHELHVRIAELRCKLFEVKVKVLEVLSTYLKYRDPGGLIEGAFSAIGDSLAADEIALCLELDYALEDHCDVGGISALLYVIGFFEMELRVGKFSKITEKYENYFVYSILDRAKRLPGGSYFDTEKQYGKQFMEELTSDLMGFDAELGKFWIDYSSRVERYLHLDVPDRINFEFRPPRRVRSVFEREIKAYGDHLIFSLSHGIAPNQALFKTPFQFMPDLAWEEVIIAFISNDTLRISARGTKQDFHFVKIGFEDGRKAEKPDSRWKTLLRMAELGSISFANKPDARPQDETKKAIQEINRRLKMLIRPDINNPIVYDRKTHSYKPIFLLEDHRFGKSR